MVWPDGQTAAPPIWTIWRRVGRGLWVMECLLGVPQLRSLAVDEGRSSASGSCWRC